MARQTEAAKNAGRRASQAINDMIAQIEKSENVDSELSRSGGLTSTQKNQYLNDAFAFANVAVSNIEHAKKAIDESQDVPEDPKPEVNPSPTPR